MIAEPVAKVVRNEDDNGFILQWEPLFDWGQLQGGERLYASSPAQARALAIQEAARVCERMTERWARRHSPGAMGQMCGLGEGTASECVDAIRALSPAPSVTQEWLNRTILDNVHLGVDATVRATLAALGIAVEGAAK